MRAFDVLTKAEYEIRGSMQPRYHLEMALLRWVHLRKLAPLTDLIKQMKSGARAAGRVQPRHGLPPPRRASARTAAAAAGAAQTVRAVESAPRRRRRLRGRRRSRTPAAGRRKPATPSRTSKPVDPGAAQGSVPRRDPQGEEVLLRHRRRAGAADRVRGGRGRVRVRPAAPRAARAARAEARVARSRRVAARRPQDDRSTAAEGARRARRRARRSRRPPTAARSPSARADGSR